jgi:uncharacterized protein
MSTRSTTVVLALAFVSCSTPQSQPSKTIDAGSFDKGALVTALGTCVLDSYRAFDVAAKKLASDPTRDNWTAASDAWQLVEVMQLGPLGGTALPGGQGLRDTFYTWPLSGRCQIDRALVTKAYANADFGTTSLTTVRGLAALEYLLFYAGTDNGCGSSEDINATGSWAALSKEELTARKAAYAKALADDLSARSGALVDLWDPSKGKFLTQFSTAGRGSTVYATPEAALNSVFDALIYVDSMTKDRKVAIPIGLVDPAACEAPPCPELLESRYSTRSLKNVRQNLVAMRKLVTGCGADFSGVGFDDLFDAVGAGAVGDELDGDLVAAIAAVDKFPHASFEEAMTKGDLESIKTIQVAIKRVTDTLKTDFVSVLHLDLPKRIAGDMD